MSLHIYIKRQRIPISKGKYSNIDSFVEIHIQCFKIEGPCHVFEVYSLNAVYSMIFADKISNFALFLQLKLR